MAKQISLEESFDKIEKIIASLEDEKVTLEESFKLYNEGLKLVKTCNSQIDKVEKQIIVLNQEDSDDEF
jgi:exodeoxyribonuclease VII small subunit